MWKKILSIIALSYFFVLLQNSFFVHFNLIGAVPNLVFILFFLIIFFLGDKPSGSGLASGWNIIILAMITGFFLDIFSYTYIGPSIVILMAIGFLLKKIKILLSDREGTPSLTYYLPLFIVSLLAYDLLINIYLYFLDINKIIMIFDIKIIIYIIYNCIFATIAFFIYRRFFKSFP